MKNVLHTENQDGFVAIVVTVVVLLVISLITIGFAQLARREQIQALDRQLSSEALYAAQSGINDTIQAIKNGTITGTNTACTGPGSVIASLATSPQLTVDSTLGGILGNISGQSQYTCVLTNDAPQSLEYSSVGQDKSAYADITSMTGIKDLVVGWEEANPLVSTVFDTVPTSNFFPGFPVTGAWKWGASLLTPVLRVDVTNLTYPGAYQRANLITHTFTGYLYPSAGATYTTVTFVSGRALLQGVITGGSCNAKVSAVRNMMRSCIVDINFTAGAPTHLFVRLKSIYGSSRVSIVALDGSLPQKPLNITGAQTVIDVTGKAANVLKRQQVRISKLPSQFPDYAIETVDSVCKRLLTPTSGNSITDIGTDSACSPN